MESPPTESGAAAPRTFCPRCRRAARDGGPLCPECGESRVAQGYCATCEASWLLPVGHDCPKHELPLEEQGPAGPAPGFDAASVAWATVAHYPHPIAAEAPRIRLEAEGIPTFLDGARMGAHGLSQLAHGGVRLQVPAELEQDARIVLAQSWAPADEQDEEDEWDELAPEPGASRRAWMRAAVAVFLVLMILRGLAQLLAML